MRDARETKEILAQRYWVDRFLELYDEQATKAGINRLFGGLIERARPGDSCFFGDILNPTRGSVGEITSEYLKNAHQRQSRQVLTAGAPDAVPDSPELAEQLKVTLRGNRQAYLDPLMLYNEVRLGVRAGTSLFGELKESGHQGGASSSSREIRRPLPRPGWRRTASRPRPSATSWRSPWPSHDHRDSPGGGRHLPDRGHVRGRRRGREAGAFRDGLQFPDREV